ncbi:helix-turn-helix transcriptional regulator [Spirosoma soli]|uniref:Helix-turn-helix transcriptional regulator n=1 Tax=Spirosoma soli TaxID=1770529 RepID=A0ABW5M1I6_9BACT
MIPQAKLLRVFKLIRLLHQQPGRTISQLADAVDLSERSVYRYLDFLETVGYSIDSNLQTKRFFLFGPGPNHPDAFTEEETDLIRHALAGVTDSNPLLAGIRQKLFLSSTLVPLADGLADIHQGQIVGKLAEGIRERVAVQLIRYHSTNSNTISDRLVEPLSFSDDYATLEAYEPASATVKTFRTKRIDAVELTDQPAQYQATDTLIDLFSWTGPCWLPVELHLTDRAYRLLIEEFPAARPDTFQRCDAPADTSFAYGWRGRVRDWRGIGRFVLGLPGEVQVIEPAEFRTYLRNRVAEFRL